MTKLIDLCDIQYGYAFDSNCFSKDNSYPQLARIRDVKRGYSETFYTGKYPKEYVLSAGDLLIGMDGEFNVARWKIDGALLNQRVCKVVAKNGTNEEYIRFFLLKQLKTIEEKTSFVTVKHLSAREINKIEVDIPKLCEQEKIATTLLMLERIEELRNRELLLLDELVRGRFVELFGHPENNEMNWPQYCFGDICTVRQGLQIPISKRLTETEENCYEYITVAYLHGGKEREYIKDPKDSVICHEDDILMTRTGNTGMVVTDVEGVFHNNFFLIDFDRNRFSKGFLVEYLNLDYIQADILRRAGTSTIPDLNHGDFYKMKIYEPPIALQKEFEAFSRQIDKSKLIVQKELDETQLLFDSLMQEYFG